MSDFSFVPLCPFFRAALAKRWKVQFRKGLHKFNNADSKTTYFNENCCIMKWNQQWTIMKKEYSTIANISRIKVHMKGRQRSEFKI